MSEKDNQMTIESFNENKNIIETSYEEEMKQSYLDYSMSVILSRAVPDVRDGLKPVQRRIIYDMKKLGLYPDKPHRKSARVVGDTMGRFHPHGDSSIYDAMVVLSKNYGNNFPVVDGQGNFGSMEGDKAAAMRYTEAKLTDYARDVLLSDLENNVVDFIPNYDEEETEPSVLPAKVPNILINGSEGIAVGMATSIPPHNINEVIDATIWQLMHPNASLDKLLEIMPGPDFPTGGVISNADELKEMYETGQGKLRVRGKTVFEKGKGRNKDKLVVTEIPYTMIGNAVGKFLQTSEQLMINGDLPGVDEISNQSTSSEPRIVFTLKKNADVKYIESVLFNKTDLENTFSFNLLAIHNNEPIQFSLQSLLKAFIDFQYDIYTRKYKSLLEKEDRKREITEGLVKAMDVIDVIYEVIRGSKNKTVAKNVLVTGDLSKTKLRTKSFEKVAKDFSFTKLQAEEILSTKLSDLVSMEILDLKKRYKEILKLIDRYQLLLSDKNELRKEIKKELQAYKKKYNKDRKTAFTNEKIKLIKREKPEVDLVCLIDRFSYAKVVNKNTYERYKDIAEQENKYILDLTSKERLVVFTDKGNAHLIKASEFPKCKVKDKGEPLDNISNFNSSDERIVGVFTIRKDASQDLLFVSSDGYIKIVDINEFDLTNKKNVATKLIDDALLSRVIDIDSFEKNVVLGTNDHRYIRFKAEEIPHQKKNSRGAIGIKVGKKAICNYAEVVDQRGDSINIKDEEVAASRIRLTKRGTKGTKIS